jgi:maleylacetate reductase
MAPDQRASGVISGYVTVQAQERIVFGKPAESAVLEEAERYGATRVFVVTTRSLTKHEDGPLQRIVKALGEKHVGTCSAIGAHSPSEDVVSAAVEARAARADLLVAVGGGSVIDATKALQLCLWHDITTPEAIDASLARAVDVEKIAMPFEPIRMVSVSTTFSAAEFTSICGVTNSRTRTKQLVIHRLFAPRSIVLDPAATLVTPEWLLFCTGIRAVDHAVETYCSPLANPATEALSLQGLRLLNRALPRIKAEPHDLQARLDAQFGMWQSVAAVAAGVETGASHGIGYVLGGTFGVAHGHTSCVLLPAVLRWNAAINADRQRALSAAMGAPDRPAADLVAELIAGLDMPRSLSDVNISRDSFDEIARRALSYEPVQMNARRIERPEQVCEILDLAW